MNVCHVDNSSYQVLLIDLDPCLAPVGFHKIIQFVELLLAGVDRNFYRLLFFTVLLLCGFTASLLATVGACSSFGLLWPS
jgi:hypothetical protein